jgi:hypothetical protein
MITRVPAFVGMALAFLVPHAAALQDCHPEPTPNILRNPGFEEDGAWQSTVPWAIVDGTDNNRNPTRYA